VSLCHPLMFSAPLWIIFRRKVNERNLLVGNSNLRIFTPSHWNLSMAKPFLGVLGQRVMCAKWEEKADYWFHSALHSYDSAVLHLFKYLQQIFSNFRIESPKVCGADWSCSVTNYDSRWEGGGRGSARMWCFGTLRHITPRSTHPKLTHWNPSAISLLARSGVKAADPCSPWVTVARENKKGTLHISNIPSSPSSSKRRFVVQARMMRQS